MSTRRERKKLASIRLRDTGMFGLGVWVLIEQVNAGPGAADPWLLGTALALLGGPAVVNSLTRALMATRSNGGGQPQPSSPSSPTSPDVSSSGTSN